MRPVQSVRDFRCSRAASSAQVTGVLFADRLASFTVLPKAEVTAMGRGCSS